MLPILENSLCGRCLAICCHYVTVEIDKPRSSRMRDDIRWYLLHEGVTLLIDRDRWMVKLPTRCRALSEDNACTIYDHRPEACREYSTEACDYHTAYEGWETDYIEIESVEEFDKYLKCRKRKRPSNPVTGKKAKR